LVVNGDKVLEQDSDNYFPLALQTLATALVDPKPLLDALRPGDRLETQANGHWKAPVFCSNPNLMRQNPGMEMVCHEGLYRGMETVGAPGHRVYFVDYKGFKGRHVARLVITSSEMSVSYRARVTELSELKRPDQSLFEIDHPTSSQGQIHVQVLPELELQSAAEESLDIIWPQVLDGEISGPSSYYVSIDRTGQVPETVPLHTTNERANDSARHQIMRWKFKPEMKEGVSLQVESILTFTTNTRAYGPPEPLTEAEVRKLASNIVEPVFPPGTASGGTCAERIAVDHEGNLIEEIADECESGLVIPCYDALKQWHFAPFMENGQPRPYRGQITCKVPNLIQN
jgi:hypothetical protein